MALNKRSATDVDKLIAARIIMARKAMGITLEDLAAGLGVTFQQVQKYCNASNRVSASRLYEIAKRLNVPINFFFEDVDNPAKYGSDLKLNIADAISSKLNRLLHYREVQRILELNDATWLVVLSVIKALANKKGNQRGEESNQD